MAMLPWRILGLLGRFGRRMYVVAPQTVVVDDGFADADRILDLGGGGEGVIGRLRGKQVTAIDLRQGELDDAPQGPIKVVADARALPFDNEFDVALMLCEGGFPLMETDEMNYQILQSAARALKRSHGKLIFTTLNGLFPLFHSVKDFLAAESKGGNATYDKNTFDLMTFRDHNVTIFVDDHGRTKELICNERYYVPSEITWLLKSLGFTKIDIYGAKLGAFSRTDALTTEDYEMLVIAER